MWVTVHAKIAHGQANTVVRADPGTGAQAHMLGHMKVHEISGAGKYKHSATMLHHNSAGSTTVREGSSCFVGAGPSLGTSSTFGAPYMTVATSMPEP